MNTEPTTITKLLIANRGEIARRIQRTAHQMGIATVAVYADSDADAPFVREADEAISLEGGSSAETYLDIQKVLSAAERTGADAIHPGYGFLAENAGFAQAVVEAGLIWVGPSTEAITAMGDKLSAKRLLAGTSVPTLPSVEVSSSTDLAAAAESVGFPLLVKASAGGGGKGMRVVEAAGGLEEAVAGAQREAMASFGDDTIFLERWLAVARHVEIQILGDEHGNLVHCFERECSIQRRHQKVIEEAPSPAVSDELRARMGEAAVAAGAAIGYSSAGTVEFLLDGEEFWFLEVNTRLQVEHPVTEEITGLDLVREQLRVACGETLAFAQEDLSITGHAIEARLYAEDPENGFLPATGTLVAYEEPTNLGVRFDSGVETGSSVGIEFDPMLAKVIVHAPTRSEAAARLARALETMRVQGVVTNRDFLVSVLRTQEFRAGDTTTDFLDRVEVTKSRPISDRQLADAALCATFAAQCVRRTEAEVQGTIPSGFRNSAMPPENSAFVRGDKQVRVLYQAQRNGTFAVHIESMVLGGGEDNEDAANTEFPAVGTERLADLTTKVTVTDLGVGSGNGKLQLVVDGRRFSASVSRDAECLAVHGPFGDVELVELPRFPIFDGSEVSGGLVAPMPGKVLALHCAPGDQVQRGDLLLVLEAMKMEHRVTAPADGTVAEVRVDADEQVDNKALLVVLADS